MSLEIWLSFVVASSILCFSPGPTVFLVVGQSLAHGKKSVLPLVFGVLTGDVIVITLSSMGLGALLATSAVLFTVMKWVGAAYLFYLGIKAWRTKVNPKEVATDAKIASGVFKDAMLVTALNPKAIVFFLAFFPLFINVEQPMAAQMTILASTFLFLSALSVAFYTLFSGRVRSKVKSAKLHERFNKISGTMLIGAGALTASMTSKS